jgi:TolA-binding protein
MMIALLRLTVAAAALAASAAPALAQSQPTPEQSVLRLERQIQQIQRRVFPQGRPADTAGFVHEPAASQASVSNLDNRLGALEQQIAQILRQSEENGHRVAQIEAQMRTAREEQERRIAGLETRLTTPAAAPAVQAAAEAPAPDAPRAAVASADDKPKAVAAVASAETDPAEEAYDAGYELWRAHKHDAAIGALRAFTSSFPKHRRVSWANNLAGRALLDDGQARAAAQVLLANYRSNPKGERAADSLFYLGQSLMKLGQPAQACKAYGELEAVYGNRMRDEIKSLLPAAKAKASCGA